MIKTANSVFYASKLSVTAPRGMILIRPYLRPAYIVNGAMYF